MVSNVAQTSPLPFRVTFASLLLQLTDPTQELRELLKRDELPLRLSVGTRGGTEPLLAIGDMIHHSRLRRHGHFVAKL